MTAVVAGDVVWASVAVAVVAWTAVTLVAGPTRLPGPAQVAGWFLSCWTGRCTLLCAWAAAGWHLFCQRP